MSTLEVNKITPAGAATEVTLGESGDTFTIPSGVTLTNNGTASGFDPSDGSITMAKLSTSATESQNVKNRVCKTWVNFNGTGTVAIRDDFNVSSITDNSTGEYIVNYSTNLGNSNYAVSICAGKAGGGPSAGNSSIPFTAEFGTYSTSGFNIVITDANGSVVDRDVVTVLVFGDS